MSLQERFLRYVRINTRSDDTVTDRTPSTEVQWDLARVLEKELKELGMQDVQLNEKCFVTATLPANTDKKIPVIGFLAHMDTSSDFNGEHVNPQIIEHYDGKDIALGTTRTLSPKEFPDLKKYIGQTLITTDGTSLLGADDKAGIAEIMCAMEYLLAHPEIKHGTIKVAFTPDEEIGLGIRAIDVEHLGADFAYTLDGGPVGEMEYENFNASRAYITVTGKSVHPGEAKDVMINSQRVFFEFDAMLPEDQRPEHTEKREGFFHLWKMPLADVEETQAVYLLRDHDAEKFEVKKQRILDTAEFLNKKYGAETVKVDIREQYRNMREVVEPVIHIVDTAKQAMRELDITPLEQPIRGGTDGAQLSYMGLPTPNLFAGGHNFHGPYEYVVLESMQKAVDVVVRIIELYAQK
ncbi:MAG: peptidase T [Anaerolineaceae bacterium]